MTLIVDGQVAGILKKGSQLSSPSSQFIPNTDHQLIIGHSSNNNKTYFDIFNVAIWEKYYYGSRGYELTGHTGTST